MAFVVFDSRKNKENFNTLEFIFKKNKINWSVVTKIISGHKKILIEILKLNIHQISDSRVSNLKIIKQLNSNIETIYIKPPAKRSIKNIIRYSDISMNTEIETIKLLNEEAENQNKIHKIIIMIELGDLREGVMGDNLISFYDEVFKLNNIHVIGIGTNLTCLNGVLPSIDKLVQLILYKQLIELKFKQKIPYVSGGSSVTIMFMIKNKLPKGINHFRIGETLFLGTDVYNKKKLKNMNTDVFTLYSEIIEINEKPMEPIREQVDNIQKIKTENKSIPFNEQTIGLRAILDLGLLDIEKSDLFPLDKSIEIIALTSDMTVVDLGENKSNYKVGELIKFSLNYMGILRIMNSKYIEKKLINTIDAT